MKSEIRKKVSFGTVPVARFSPEPGDEMPKALNVHLTFEDALKLSIGLQAILLELNSYNRHDTAGKNTGVNLCVFTDVKSITINLANPLNKPAPKPARKTKPKS